MRPELLYGLAREVFVDGYEDLGLKLLKKTEVSVDRFYSKAVVKDLGKRFKETLACSKGAYIIRNLCDFFQAAVELLGLDQFPHSLLIGKSAD